MNWLTKLKMMFGKTYDKNLCARLLKKNDKVFIMIKLQEEWNEKIKLQHIRTPNGRLPLTQFSIIEAFL